jgi:hypothetical protein
MNSWMVGVEVVGGIYSPNHQTTVGEGLLSMGAPNSHPTVRVLTQSTVGALTSGGTGQSGATSDSHCSLSGAPLTSVLTSAVNCSAVRGTVQSTVALKSRCSAGAPDSPVNYSGATLEKPEGEEFRVVQPWCNGHCLVAHRTVRCVRPGHTSVLLLLCF